jgi:hypothetical protein
MLPRIAAALIAVAALSPATLANATTAADSRTAVSTALASAASASVSDQARRIRKARVVTFKRSAPVITYRHLARFSYIHGIAY